MEAGRELDVLVAEKVMGYRTAPIPDGETANPPNFWPVAEDGDTILTHINAGLVPHYSTDIAAAWDVIVWMLNRFDCAVMLQWDMQHFQMWHAGFGIASDKFPDAIADTPAHAICLAALRAVGVEV
jgi:hypothetical protein